MHYRPKTIVFAFLVFAVAGFSSSVFAEGVGVSTASWINGAITTRDIVSHTWTNGDQYRYGNVKYTYVDGYRWATPYSKFSETNQAVLGVSAYLSQGKIMSYDSTYWQQLDLSDYYHATALPNAGTDAMAIVTNSYQNYYGATSELHYISDVPQSFGTFTKDSAGNVVRHQTDSTSDKVLRYADGTAVGLSSMSGMSFSANGRWLYVDITAVGQLRIDTADFSVLSFASGFSPYYSVFTDTSNDGNTIATYTKDRGLKVYDLTDCDDEKPQYASRNCASRDLTVLLQNGIKASLDTPSLFDSGTLTPKEVKFVSNSALRVLVSYTYGGQARYSFVTLQLDSGDVPLRYLALGDSFSSGEGTFDYVGETNFYTDVNEYNLCHLSGISYPYLVNAAISSTWFGSVACSGSLSGEVVSTLKDKDYIGQSSRAGIMIADSASSINYSNLMLEKMLPGYIPQNSMVKHYTPSVATITIGGNDIGFGDIVAECITQPACFSGRNEREKKADEIASTILGMSAKLRVVRESMSGPNPRLYVLGYPSIVSYVNGGCSLIGQAERERLDALEGYLNESIKIAAHNAGAIYVDLTGALVPSTEEDHRICGNAALAANGFVPAGDARSRQSVVAPGNIFGAESYHPNMLGHQLIAADVLRLTNNLQLEPTTTLNQARPDDSYYERFVGDTDDLVNETVNYQMITSYESAQRGNSLDITIRQQPGWLPSPNGQATIELHSDPVVLGTIPLDPTSDTTAQVTIPSDTSPGWHELHILYTDIEGKQVDIYQYIYVIASENDYDGDGIPNNEEACSVGGTLGVDVDDDGIDDACDAQIKKEQSGTLSLSTRDQDSVLSSGSGQIALQATARNVFTQSDQLSLPITVTPSSKVSTVNQLPGMNDLQAQRSGGDGMTATVVVYSSLAVILLLVIAIARKLR